MEYTIIDKPDQFLEIAKELEKEQIVGLDTEFIRESSFYPKLSLIQIANSKTVWIIDALKIKTELLSSLSPLITNKKILKIFHAGRLDQECLYYSVGNVASPVLDTSIGAALLGYGDSLGLEKVLKIILKINLKKGKARTNWLIRPIPETLIKYAVEDAKYLVVLGKELIKELKKFNRLKWALEESTIDPAVFEINREELMSQALKVQLEPKEKGIFYELLLWREKEARKENLPRSWIINTDILKSISKAKPQSLEELKMFRGIHKRFVKRSGEEILKIIATAPPIEKMEKSVVDENLLTLINLYVKLIAKKYSIIGRFLLSKEKIEKILTIPLLNKKELIDNKIVNKHTAKIILNPLWDFISGRRALIIKNKKLCEIKI